MLGSNTVDSIIQHYVRKMSPSMELSHTIHTVVIQTILTVVEDQSKRFCCKRRANERDSGPQW